MFEITLMSHCHISAFLHRILCEMEHYDVTIKDDVYYMDMWCMVVVNHQVIICKWEDYILFFSPTHKSIQST